MSTIHITPADVAQLAPPEALHLDSIVEATVDWDSHMKSIEFKERTLSLHQKIASTYSRSGSTNASNADQIVMILQLGASMGFSEAESVNGIHLIEGKPTIGAHLRAAKMKRAGYDWRFSQCDNAACIMTLYFRGQQIGECSFTIAEAQGVTWKDKAGATKKLVDKDNWRNSPSDMLFARCITRAQRRFAPHVLAGAMMDPDEADNFAAVIDATQRVQSEMAAARVDELKARLTVKVEADKAVA